MGQGVGSDGFVSGRGGGVLCRLCGVGRGASASARGTGNGLWLKGWCVMVIFKILGIGLFGVAGLVLVILFMPWATDPAIDCLDNGGVWDGVAARCRCDCLTWNEEDGCVPLPEGTGANPGCMRLYGVRASARGTGSGSATCINYPLGRERG